MAEAAIYDSRTGRVMSVLRDDDKDYAGIVANKPLLPDQTIADITHLSVPELTNPVTLEIVQRYILSLIEGHG